MTLRTWRDQMTLPIENCLAWGLGPRPAFGELPVNPLGLALHLPSSTLHISKTPLSSLTPTAIEGGLQA